MGFGIELTTKDATVRLGRFRSARTARCSRPTARRSRPAAAKPASSRGAGRSRAATTRTTKKIAETFRTLEGRRWSIPGDWLHGERRRHARTSSAAARCCINTAGEKVYPEEVEETLKLHPAVRDAVVVGVPDEKWGEAVTAVIELEAGRSANEAALRELRARAARRLQGAEAPGVRRRAWAAHPPARRTTRARRCR